MAFTQSMLWTTNGVGDGLLGGYARDRWAEFLRAVFGNGVMRGVDGELQVIPGGPVMTILSGAIICDGLFARDPVGDSVNVPLPVIGPTGKRIVVAADWDAQMVRINLLSNNDGVPLATQVPPLTQISGVRWEIPLAKFDITPAGQILNFEDEREFCHFATEVLTANIANNAVTSAKVASGAIATANIADNAVTNVKIAGGAIKDAQVASDAAIAQSKISNAVRAIDADMLDGQHGSYYARGMDIAQSGSVYAGTTWYVPTAWSVVDGMVLNVSAMNGPCDFMVIFTVSRPTEQYNRRIWFRARVGSMLGNTFLDFMPAEVTRTFHWYFATLPQGQYPVQVEAQAQSSGPISERRMTVIVIPK